jgi:glutamate transport system substrate-binding protein
MQIRRALAIVAAAAVASVGLTACGSGDDYSSIVDKAKDTGKLTIGVKFDQPGLGLKKEDGTFAGFDIDVARYIAKELGVDAGNIEFKETPSAQRETALKNHEVDFIVATYSITDERKDAVSFAGPYFIAHQDLLVKADNTDITGPESLNNKKLCSVTGSTSAQKVEEKFANEVQLKNYGGYSDCVQALASGAVDAVTTDDVILAGYAAAKQYQGKFKVVGEGFSDEHYGVGLWKGDTKAQAAVNAAIQKMESDGSWEKALQDNDGPSGYAIPKAPKITEK